jgi:hypothetical protein
MIRGVEIVGWEDRLHQLEPTAARPVGRIFEETNEGLVAGRSTDRAGGGFFASVAEALAAPGAGPTGQVRGAGPVDLVLPTDGGGLFEVVRSVAGGRDGR